MYDVNRVLSVAEAEVGYLEKANNKNLDGKTENAGDKNYTKYARDLDAIPGLPQRPQAGLRVVRRVCGLVLRHRLRQGRGAEAAVSADEERGRGMPILPQLLQGEGAAVQRAAAGRPDFLLAEERHRRPGGAAHGAGSRSR